MLTRKQFIKYLWIIISAPFLYVWSEVYHFEKAKQKLQNTITIDKPVNDGFYIYDNFFINVKGNKFYVLSRKCTHLGCKLMETSDIYLTCPCHGSVFTKTGTYLSGPANKNLISLDFHLDKKNNKLMIQVD